MRAAVLAAPGRVTVEDVPDPVPQRDGVVIEVEASGICGTDLHLVDGELAHVPPRLVPGHEVWGRVVAVGAEVARTRVGDAVAVDPSLHCGECAPCRRGRGNMCERWGAIGATVPGGWADYVAVPEASLYQLDDNFPLEAAVLLEPVACALRGLERLAPVPDQPVLIFGGGTIGILLALLLDARGVGPVTIVDLRRSRRELARSLTGATVRGPDELAGERAPWVIEATGNPAAFTQALDHVDRAGHLLVFGVAPPSETAQVSPYRIYADELTIVGSMAILRSFPPAIDAVRRQADRLQPLITHRFGLSSIDDALATVRAGQSVKTVIQPGVDRRG